jgi:hypothetical protein
MMRADLFMASSSSSQERLARGIVRAVEGRVAVGAGAPEQAVTVNEELALVVKSAGMAGIRMAALAEERFLRLEHLHVVGAVDLMAVHAVLANGDVLPKEGAALFGVAPVA